MADFYAARTNTMPALPWPNLQPPYTLQDQLRRRSEPFDALWACRAKISDGAYLAPLRSHALRVLRVISSLSGGGSNSSAWDGVYHDLHQALSLQSVVLYTNVFNAQIRLVLLLLQAIIARVEADHDVWFDDGVSIQELIFALQKEIPSDACDEADAPSLFTDQKFIHDNLGNRL
ncbi:hypothetical protein [Celeribacter sp.]|uniref:hypothetical protein n=1 Tax=Celeribacter sp. TaxID=1890673 RepID=UPI003A94ABBD